MPCSAQRGHLLPIYTNQRETDPRCLAPTYGHVSNRLAIVLAEDIHLVVKIFDWVSRKELITLKEAVAVASMNAEIRRFCIALDRTFKQ